MIYLNYTISFSQLVVFMYTFFIESRITVKKYFNVKSASM